LTAISRSAAVEFRAVDCIDGRPVHGAKFTVGLNGA
jgi:hypothetical protein